MTTFGHIEPEHQVPIQMRSTDRQKAFDECAAICREIMDQENAYARKNPSEDTQLHALRWSRYGTAKQILERIAALPHG